MVYSLKTIILHHIKTLTPKSTLFITLSMIAATALILFFMGRLPICECGFIKFWHGQALSTETSQHLFDPYTFTHVLHGIIFYFLLWLFARRLPASTRFLLAVGIEGAWEVLENTPLIIDRYRTATISLDYYGDTIINAIGDIIAMMAGFAIAWRLPVWATLLIVAGIEIILGYTIRDGLFLNLLQLIYPIESIKEWQARS